MADDEKSAFTPSMLYGTFYPTGCLVAIVPDQERADQVKEAVTQAGFAENASFTGQEVLAQHKELMESRTPLERLGSMIAADEKLIQEEYLDEVRRGNMIVIVRVPDEAQLDSLRQTLVEHGASMLRYYATNGVVELSPP